MHRCNVHAHGCTAHDVWATSPHPYCPHPYCQLCVPRVLTAPLTACVLSALPHHVIENMEQRKWPL